jgi:hypothetical protein
MLTWDKVEIGRGQVLREQTEHAILLTRGKPLIDVFGEDPPTTLHRAEARKLAQAGRVLSPGRARHAGETLCVDLLAGGEGELWDGHGDQVGKFAPALPGGLEGAHSTTLPSDFRTVAEMVAAIAAEWVRTSTPVCGVKS